MLRVFDYMLQTVFLFKINLHKIKIIQCKKVHVLNQTEKGKNEKLQKKVIKQKFTK